MSFRRPSADLIARAAASSSATLHEALGSALDKRGHLPGAIQSTAPSLGLCGPAFPVRCIAGSNINLHHAIYEARPGDVIVAVTDGAPDYGYWGEVMAVAAVARGIAGLVIDGGVRDTRQMAALGFPVFSRGRSIRGTLKHAGGSLAEPILFGETVVNAGDLVLGDDDGVVVLPLDEAEAAIERGEQRDLKEQAMFTRLRTGETTLQLFGFPPRPTG